MSETRVDWATYLSIVQLDDEHDPSFSTNLFLEYFSLAWLRIVLMACYWYVVEPTSRGIALTNDRCGNRPSELAYQASLLAESSEALGFQRVTLCTTRVHDLSISTTTQDPRARAQKAGLLLHRLVRAIEEVENLTYVFLTRYIKMSPVHHAR